MSSAKKHIQALERIKSALVDHELMTPEVHDAWELVKEAVSALPKESAPGKGPLPVPEELKGNEQGLALYTDGACRGNPGPGAWATVAQRGDGSVVFESCGHESLTTNNKMEIQAVIGALYQLEQHILSNPFEQISPILLFTDSKYVVDGLNQWVPGWKSRGWKKADGKTPENLDLWQELEQLKAKFPQVKIGWVKGHNGHPQNEHCDRLANKLLDEEGF